MSLWIFLEKFVAAAPARWQRSLGLIWLAHRAAVKVYPDKTEMLGSETVWKTGDRTKYAERVDLLRQATELSVSPTTFLSNEHLVVRDEYQNGFLSGFKPMPFTSQKALIGSPVDYWRRGHWRRGDIRKLNGAARGEVRAHLNNVCLLDEGGAHFGHWVFEMLPTIQYMMDLDCAFVVLGWDGWKMDYLRKLGVDDSSIVKWNGRDSFSFGRLYILRGGRLIVRERLEWLKAKLQPRRDSHGSGMQRVYVSRQGRNRCISNFEELVPVLNRWGFVILDPGRLTLEETIEAFEDAKYIVGPEGSGIRNFLWSEGSSVMEIHSGLVTLGQWQFAAQMGHSYVPYLVDSADSGGQRPFEGIHIDAMHFEVALEAWISNG